MQMWQLRFGHEKSSRSLGLRSNAGSAIEHGGRGGLGLSFPLGYRATLRLRSAQSARGDGSPRSARLTPLRPFGLVGSRRSVEVSCLPPPARSLLAQLGLPPAAFGLRPRFLHKSLLPSPPRLSSAAPSPRRLCSRPTCSLRLLPHALPPRLLRNSVLPVSLRPFSLPFSSQPLLAARSRSPASRPAASLLAQVAPPHLASASPSPRRLCSRPARGLLPRALRPRSSHGSIGLPLSSSPLLAISFPAPQCRGGTAGRRSFDCPRHRRRRRYFPVSPTPRF